MKRRVSLVLGLALWLVVGFGGESGYATASKDINSLNPNEYKEKEFKNNKEYLHNQSLLKDKKAIPEEQKPLDFIPTDYDKNEKIREELFIQDFQERKTVAYESMKLGLFSAEKEAAKVRMEQPSSERDRGNKGLMYIYIGLLVACIVVVLIWLVPKMIQGEKD